MHTTFMGEAAIFPIIQPQLKYSCACVFLDRLDMACFSFLLICLFLRLMGISLFLLLHKSKFIVA